MTWDTYKSWQVERRLIQVAVLIRPRSPTFCEGVRRKKGKKAHKGKKDRASSASHPRVPPPSYSLLYLRVLVHVTHTAYPPSRGCNIGEPNVTEHKGTGSHMIGYLSDLLQKRRP